MKNNNILLLIKIKNKQVNIKIKTIKHRVISINAYVNI